jgi:protein-S-isoprenylcysteine O-methyltransferase
MSLAAIQALFRALGIWPFLVVTFVCLVLAGVVHGPWNYYWFFAMGCWAVLHFYWALAARTTKPTFPNNRHRLAALALMMTQALYCLPLSSVPVLGQRILPRFAPLEPLGGLMCLVGVAFAIWARHVLGGNWNAAVILQKRHALVRSGPYAIVRHPIYFGFLVTAGGMFLVLGEIRALACLCHAAGSLTKMSAEESILRAAYADEYPEYERRVKRLLPGIW